MPWMSESDIVSLADKTKQRFGKKNAYFTMATKGFEVGVIALQRSLARYSPYPLVAMCTDDVDLELFDRFGITPLLVRDLENPRSKNNDRFLRTYTKLRVFEQVEWERIIFLDADMLVLSSPDELFDRPEDFLVCPDLGIELHYERFNSGMMVVRPSLETMAAMQNSIGVLPSYDGSDQGFLNSFYQEKWTSLPHRFNTLVRLLEFHPEVFDLSEVAVLHYVGPKPWQLKFVKPVYREVFGFWLESIDESLAKHLLKTWMQAEPQTVPSLPIAQPKPAMSFIARVAKALKRMKK